MKFISTLVKWMNENPGAVLGSLATNAIFLIKWVYSSLKTRRLGKAKLAAKRFKELYIPLCNELNEVKIESFIAYKGTRKSLLKKAIKDSWKYLLLKESLKSLKNSWNDFRNRVLIGPSYDFPLDTPDLDLINKILTVNSHLVPEVLNDKWANILILRRESYHYPNEDINEELAEFIIYLRKVSKETQIYLEKKYPSFLADL